MRDLGGLRTDDGRTTLPRRLLRADNLQDLSEADVRLLVDDFGVRQAHAEEVATRNTRLRSNTVNTRTCCAANSSRTGSAAPRSRTRYVGPLPPDRAQPKASTTISGAFTCRETPRTTMMG